MSIEINNQNKYDIFNFLDEHIVENGKVHTHTSMHNPKASYFIKSSDLNIFYELYEKAILEGIELHITEKRQEFFPMTIDLDFKYELETFERKHNETHIKKIIELYVNEIINILNIDKNNQKLISFVFERDESYKAKGITKDGIHIQFPFIITHPAVQYFIRDNILKKIGDIISDMELKNIIPDIVDRSVISPNTLWLLYGSNKDKPKGNPYKLKYIYDGNSNKLSIIDYFGNQNVNLAQFFSIRDKRESDIISIRDDKIHLIENTNKKKIIKKTVNNINYDPVRIRELVFILNNERADNYNQWIEIGWALHNIDPNSQDLLDIWIDFSKKSSKFKDGECEKLWEKSKNEGLTIACIHYWAKIDNNKKYDEYKDKDIGKWIDLSIKTQSNYDIAYVLFKMYEYDFVFSDNDWYIYKNHVWRRENDGMSLRQKISNDLCRKYANIMSYYNQVASGQILINNQELTEEEKEEYKKKNGIVLEVIKKLKTTAFKENVMKECKELFFNKDFVKKLDSNPYLVGFTNGIYDLKKGELRDGRPDDYVEMNTEIDKIDFDENHENWFELENFINTVFFEEDVRHYFLTYFASCLQGHNAEEKFRIWTGVGSNGKSKILELFVHCLGMYSIKFPITMLTGKRAASNACTPEIVQSKGKRFGYFEEPSENERINAGLLKEFTGGDKIKARGLHKEPIEFKPQFKLALLCNEMPEVPPNDSGTWRRMEVIEFKSRFCENPKESHEFPIDKYLSEKLKNWKELFMALLLDVYYVKYKKDGIKVPLEIIKFTLEYQKQCDLYTDFIYENLEDTKDNLDIIDITQLYDEFKVWYVDTFSNHKFPSKVEFKKYLKKRYTTKRISINEIKGFKFKFKYEKKITEPHITQGY
jgi:P4 family phage/plasmid primase-like protien